MKAAFCLSGLSRSIPVTYSPIKKYFLDPYNCDVFFKTWSNTDNGEEDFSPIKAVELYRPAAWEIEYFDQSAFEGRAELNFFGAEHAAHLEKIQVNRRYRVLSMWYNVMRCYEIAEAHVKSKGIRYDLIFRGRPDGTYFTRFDFNNAEPKTLYIISSSFNDGFAAGTPDVMREFSYLYLDLLDQYSYRYYDLKPELVWCPHTLLNWHLEDLESKGIKVVKLKDNIRVGKIWSFPTIKLEDNIWDMVKFYEEHSKL